MALGGIGSPIGRLIGDPPLSKTDTLSAVFGSFVLTGEAAAFRVDYVCADGTFALTGEPAALTRSYPSSVGSFALTGEGASFEIELNLNASYPAGPAGIGAPIGRHIGGVEYLREAGVGLFEITGKDTVLTPAIVATTAGYVLSGPDILFIVNPPVVDTDRLDLPINCVLARTQLFKDRFRENSIFAPRIKEKVAATSSGVTRLKGTKPSFTVKTSTKGYD